MFNRRFFENSHGGGLAALEVPEQPAIGQRHAFVPLRRTEIGGELLGPLAVLTVTHVFRYERAQCDKVLEAVYRFPLPGDAAVTGVTVTFGATEIRADLKERRAAKEEYALAKAQGRQATLVEREAPDVFTLRVTGLRPDEDVVVETAYVQLAWREGVGWRLRLPLTVAPRYSRADENDSLHANGQPGALACDPGHTFALDLRAVAAAVESPTHALALGEEDGRLRVRLAAGAVTPDRDCVLTWRPRQEESAPVLDVLAHVDRAEEQVYFLALVAPPAHPDPQRTVAREVLLLTDHSGSMSGPKWEAADWATKRFLADLNERDAFNLGVFHTSTAWFAPAPVRGGRDERAQAQRFLASHRDSGGTELGVALEQALRQRREEGPRARHVLLITDAQVTDLGRILRLAEEESRQTNRRRISVLCIDAAPNSYLVHELAARGGGVARFLTSDPREEDITTALDDLLADWAQPALAGLRLEVNRPRVEGAGNEAAPPAADGWAALDLGDLPCGRAVWVAGRAPLGEGSELRLRLRDAEGHEVATLRLPLGVEEREPALKALFGARRVAGLEFLVESGRSGKELAESLRRLGYDPVRDLAGGAAPTVYAENVSVVTKNALEALLLRESLRYGLASAATAFIAVRREGGEQVEESVLVPNALPHGWSELFGDPMVLTRPFGAHSAPRPFSSPSLLFRRLPVDQHPSADAVISTPPARAQRQTLDSTPAETCVYAGAPHTKGGQTVLYDSATAPTKRRFAAAHLGVLSVRFPAGAPVDLDPHVVVLIYVDDLATPRARVRLVDLVAGDERPLNIALPARCRLLIVLSDPNGRWAAGGPRLELRLRA